MIPTGRSPSATSVRTLLATRAGEYLLYVSVIAPSGSVTAPTAALAGLLTLTVVRTFTLRSVSALVTFLTLQLAYEAPSLLNLVPATPTPVAVSADVLFRSSSLVFVALVVLGRPKLALLPLGTGAVVAAAGVALFNMLELWRPDMEQLAAWVLGYTVLVEGVNAFWFMRSPAIPMRPPRLLAVLSAVVLVFMRVATTGPAPEYGQEVTFWWPSEESAAEFKTVDDGSGLSRIGHWGELPRLLERVGYNVTKLDSLEKLQDAHSLVLPTPFRRLRPSEYAAVQGFVTGGGRLLVVAEHTNLESVRDIYNPLLAPFGIEVNFDTTNNLFGDTLVGTQSSLDSVARVLQTTLVTHNRGASLAAHGFRPVPLLRGRYWHGDLGDPLAPDRGYLSDYRLSFADRIGGLTLAVRAPAGRGEVLVWGDSSPFLNQNIAYNSRFLIALFDSMSGGLTINWRVPLLGVLLLAGFCLAWLISNELADGFGFGVVCAAIGSTALLSYGTPEVRAHDATAVISVGENNEFSRDPFDAKSMTALGVWATRSGFVPWIGDWEAVGSNPNLLFVVNPRSVIRDRYAQRLNLVADRGGTVVISGGGDNSAFRDLATRFGVTVVGEPVGRLSGTGPSTYCAWHTENQGAAPIIVNGITVGGTKLVGKGKIVVLADSGFFYSKNLETEDWIDSQNQAFLTSLVR